MEKLAACKRWKWVEVVSGVAVKAQQWGPVLTETFHLTFDDSIVDVILYWCCKKFHWGKKQLCYLLQLHVNVQALQKKKFK
jgi:hypothetical protein